MKAELTGTRPPVLSDGLHRAMTELKGFRHRVRHNYGFDLDPARSDENLARLRRCLPEFVAALQGLERALTVAQP